MIPDKNPPADKSRPKRSWFRRLVRGLGWTLLVLVLVHRPLIHYGVPPLVRVLAKRQHLDVRFALAGSIFTNLRVSAVRVTPTGTGPTPVEKIEIAELRFDYSLIKLLRDGVGQFLHSYEAHHADLIFTPTKGKTREGRKQTVTVAQQLNNLLAQPAAYADRVWIEDFKVRVRSPETDTVIGPVTLTLDPQKPGELRIERVQAPGIPVWENLTGATNYEGRNLFIRDLALTPELVVQELNFEPSPETKKAGKMRLTAQVFGGSLKMEMSGTELAKPGEKLEKAYATNLQINAAGVDVPALLGYFGMTRVPVGRLTKFELKFAGEPEQPQTWDSSFLVQVETVAAGPLALASVELSGETQGGRASLRGGFAVSENSGSFAATAALPASIKELPRTDAEATIAFAAPRLEALGSSFQPALAISGGAALEAKVAVRAERVSADGKLNLNKAAFAAQSAERGELTFKVSKPLKNDPRSPLIGLSAAVAADLGALRAGGVAIDTVRLSGAADGPQVTLRSLLVQRGENEVSAKGTYLVPADMKNFAAAPADVDFAIRAPTLETFGVGTGERILAGKLEAHGLVRNVSGVPAGEITLAGSDFKFGSASAQQLSTKVTLASGSAVIEELTVTLDEANGLVASGKVGVAAPFAYEARLQVDLPELARFQNMLESFGIDKKLAGAIALSWTGNGEAQPARHSGDLTFAAKAVRYDKLEVRELRLAGGYTPEAIRTRELHVESGPTNVDAVVELREQRLRVSDLIVRQGVQQALTGALEVPLDPANAKATLSSTEPISAKLTAANLDLAKLFASLGKPPPVNGTITAELLAEGTMVEPRLNFQMAARGIKATAAPKYDAAEVNVTLVYAQKLLELEAFARQPLIQPLTISARVPIELNAAAGAPDPQTPVTATIKLPSSSLAFLPKIVPAVRRLDGTAALDVRVSGTIAKPEIGGQASLRIKSARMAAPAVPSIDDFTMELAFADDTLAFQTFRGLVGGGRFNLGGRVRFESLTNPVFELAMTADEVLVKRDDLITIRTDADLKLTGPLNRASASGTIWITNSRFFKEIDILPIGLPGRPKPAPRSAPKAAGGGGINVSFPNPPLRDWTFDIALKTRPGDPFLIRGNLANGAASVDLKLGGTGLQPWLDGAVRVEQFTGTLPFSRLSITQGFIYFKKDQPFEPLLELQAESKIRDYTVRAYIHGSATAPEVELTSEPPLSYADIVSLLATGMTASQLSGGADALASQAAFLAVQQLYRKVFKKERSRTPPPQGRAAGESFFDRFEFMFGALDNRTGAREMETQFKINEDTYLVGELDTQGQFTGSLKYLIRFR